MEVASTDGKKAYLTAEQGVFHQWQSRRSGLNMLHWTCLLDEQMEMLNMQLDIWIWTSEYYLQPQLQILVWSYS